MFDASLEYYRDLIDDSAYSINDVETAVDIIEELKEDRLIPSLDHSLYSLLNEFMVHDNIEGLILLNPDILESMVFSDGQDAWYIQAILEKFPELQGEYSLSKVMAVQDTMETATDIVQGINGNSESSHYKWRDELAKLYSSALRNAESI